MNILVRILRSRLFTRTLLFATYSSVVSILTTEVIETTVIENVISVFFLEEEPIYDNVFYFVCCLKLYDPKLTELFTFHIIKKILKCEDFEPPLSVSISLPFILWSIHLYPCQRSRVLIP